MRISIYGFALGITCVAALAAPLVPANWMPDIMHAPAGHAIPQIAESGARAIGGLLSMAALADEAPAQPIDFSNLVKIDDLSLEVSYDDSVSTEVISYSQVRKIGFGNESTVNVVKTLSGTYSSDSMASPHVLYPGVKVRAKSSNTGPVSGALNAIRKTGFGWMALPFDPMESVISHGPIMGGGRYIAGNGHTCMTSASFTTCS